VDEPGDGWNTAPAFVPSTVWGVAPIPDLAVESKRRARLPILAASYRVSIRRVSPAVTRLAGMTAYLRVLAYQKVAPRHAGAWLRCR
jgi:hypothetical protein